MHPESLKLALADEIEGLSSIPAADSARVRADFGAMVAASASRTETGKGGKRAETGKGEKRGGGVKRSRGVAVKEEEEGEEEEEVVEVSRRTTRKRNQSA